MPSREFIKLVLICCSIVPISSACHVPNRIAAVLDPEPTTDKIINPTVRKLVAGGIAQTDVTKSYDPAYVALTYPGGDVPMGTGVCTDVIIRAYRQIGIDLQQKVHEDMRRNFAAYPKIWGLKQPDKNIDHRRVANLMTFFKRRSAELPISKNSTDYLPGDIIAYDLGRVIN